MDSSIKTVGIVGGDERAWGGYPEGVEVRRYGSTRFKGNGALRQVLAAIASGGLDVVVLMVRWLGHPASEQVRAACSRGGIRCLVVPGGESSMLRVVRELVGEV